jgi:hypothetical protein
MTIPVDTSNDWQYIEGRETITYLRRAVDGLFTAQSVNEAKRSAPTKEEIEADADLAKYGVIWTVWRNQLNGLTPRYVDVIQDQYGDKYSIKAIQLLSLQQRFRCQCLRQVK